MIKINKVVRLKLSAFILFLLCQPSLLAHSITAAATDNSHKENRTVKKVQLKIVKLTDNSGLTYLGGKVNPDELELYLSQMKQILGDDFSLYRQNQATRDHQTFHMTLINPFEYQELANDDVIGSTMSVSLIGLGQVSSNDKTTFFVVAQSPEAQKYRQGLLLKKKDFHVTLGFNPSDVYGVNKGIESLIEL